MSLINCCCEPAGTPFTRAACCFPDGDCVDYFENDPEQRCTDDGGIPQGLDTKCVDLSCPQQFPRQACCLGNGGCVDVHPIHCLAVWGGTPQGDGTVCATTDCEPPPPPPRDICAECQTGESPNLLNVSFEGVQAGNGSYPWAHQAEAVQALNNLTSLTRNFQFCRYTRRWQWSTQPDIFGIIRNTQLDVVIQVENQAGGNQGRWRAEVSYLESHINNPFTCSQSISFETAWFQTPFDCTAERTMNGFDIGPNPVQCGLQLDDEPILIDRLVISGG